MLSGRVWAVMCAFHADIQPPATPAAEGDGGEWDFVTALALPLPPTPRSRAPVAPNVRAAGTESQGGRGVDGPGWGIGQPPLREAA